MFAGFEDILTSYLVPFAIAVPVAILLFLLVTRRDRDDVRRPREPNLPPAPAPARAPAPSMSIASFAPLPPRAPMPSAVPAPRPAVAAPVARAAPTAPGAPTAPPEAAPSPPAPISLLVADDSAVARAKLRKLFESAGYQVDVAADGEEALELLTRKPYAVLITDLEMPKMDGFQVIAAVLGSLETEDLPIIAITGHEELSARVHDMQGLFGIFKKPWNDRELLRRVAAVSTLRRQAANG